jgi:hypothetical protein
MRLEIAPAFSGLARRTIMPHNAVQRPRDHVSSAPQVNNEMARVRRAHADVSRSAATVR